MSTVDVTPFVTVVSDFDGHFRPLFDALGQNVLLMGIVVTAAAEHEQGANRLGVFGDGGGCAGKRHHRKERQGERDLANRKARHEKILRLYGVAG